MRYSDQGDQERLVDLRLEIQGETEKAVAVLNSRGRKVWLPKSQIGIDELTAPPTLTIPEWLVDERELDRPE